MAAKEGLENAKKVKTLEAENKKMNAENKVLTDNFNAERVSTKQSMWLTFVKKFFPYFCGGKTTACGF